MGAATVSRVLSGNGYVKSETRERNYEQRYLDMLKRRVVDGIIFAAHTSLDIAQYQDLNRPILSFDRILEPDIPCVSADHEEGGRLAAEEFLRVGCKNVLQFVCAHPWNMALSSQPPVREPQSSRESKKWVLTPADQRHVVFQQIMEVHGRSVPGDLKIVSYDSTAITRFMTPSLTVICQPLQALADQAVRIILQLIQGEPVEEKRITLPVALRRGGTTGDG